LPCCRQPRQDARRLARLENDHDRIGLGAAEIGVDEFVAAAFRRLYDRDAALDGKALEPGLEILRNAAQHLPAQVCR
jgi:hypothetical protein